MSVVTAIGASVDSNFYYARVKGELERDLKAVGFESLTIARPNMIGGDRSETRIRESIALSPARLLRLIIPPKFRVNPAERIAGVLLDAGLQQVPGCHYRYAEGMVAQ